VTFAPGNRVIIRDAEWIVKQVKRSSDRGFCLDVVGISPFVKDREAKFLTNLEDDIKVMDPVKTRLVQDTSSNFKDTRLYIETLLRNTPSNNREITHGGDGAMDPVQYQMDPARMALKEPRCRILIADAVGLGKTIEAGILLTELIARGRGKRILVVALKSMLTQFQKELWSRFSIPLVRLDSAGITRIRNRIPSNYNPFYYYDKTIISMDTLKRETEYRYWLENSYWDIIVIDEAHNVARRSDRSQRFKLAERLSYQCDSLVMLSATPHDGRKESFASLMTMLNPAAIDVNDYGPEDIRGMFIRRFKKDIKDQVPQAFPEREINKQRCPASASEEEIFTFIKSMQFADRVLHGRSGKLLFKTVLEKSFLSSPKACLSTVTNRLKRLMESKDFASQMSEIRELETLKGLLQGFNSFELSKLNYLAALLSAPEYGWDPGKTEDRIVVFTERIETMKFLLDQLVEKKILKDDQVTVLYGGMSDMDVQQVVEDFGKEVSPLRMIIASDIAAEGINLHYLSHRMIHFDIPWSLMTFQQRNGRIDRYGQTRKPLITYFLTEYDDNQAKGDLRILELLIKKDQQVQENIGDPGEFTGLYDIEEEENLTARAIENNLTEEEFESSLSRPEDDFFTSLFGENPENQPESKNDYILPRLFSSDFTFYTQVLRRLKDRHSFQFEPNKQEEILSITRPKGFASRERFLPTEVVPQEAGRYLFTTDRALVMEDIARSRKEENIWPTKNLLWDFHPLMRWLRDDVTTLFGRHEAPLAAVPTLEKGETIVLFYGLIPNKRGHTVINDWKGLLYKGEQFIEALSVEDTMKRLKLTDDNIPNAGKAVDTTQFTRLFPNALKEAEKIMLRSREKFGVETSPILKDQYSRLKTIRDKRLKQLELDFHERLGNPGGVRKDRYNQAREQADKDFENYMEWIENHINTEEKSYIRFIAVFTGDGFTYGGNR
jgi:superfamily II DNA or RNA helicase